MRTRLAEALRLYMDEHRYSTRDLAKLTGISSATIHRMTWGKECNSRQFIKLLAWLSEEHT